MADFIFDRAKEMMRPSPSAGVSEAGGVVVGLSGVVVDFSEDFRGVASSAGASFNELAGRINNATTSFEEFGDRMRSDAGWQPRSSTTFPPVFLWLPLLQIGRVIMTLRLDTGRLMTVRPRWDADQGELIGTFQVKRQGRVVGVVLSDDRGNLLYADDDLAVTLVPGEDLVVGLTINID